MAPSKLTQADIISHILRHVRLILKWTAHDTLESYEANEERQAAVERWFIAIGEAFKDLQIEELLKLDPTFDWRSPPKFRDFLAHRYVEGITHPLVWSVIKNELPKLEKIFADYLKEEPEK